MNHNNSASGRADNDSNFTGHQDAGGEREKNAFSQSTDSEDENGAGGSLGASEQTGKDDSRFSNDNPGGAGSTGSAATNDGDELT